MPYACEYVQYQQPCTISQWCRVAWLYVTSTVCAVCGDSFASHPHCPAPAAELFEAACRKVLLPQGNSGMVDKSPSEPPAAAVADSSGKQSDTPNAAAADDQAPHAPPGTSSSSTALVSDGVERAGSNAAAGQGSTAAAKVPGPGDEGSVALLRRVRAFCRQAVTALQRGNAKGRIKGQAAGAGQELDAGVAEQAERLACMQFGVERFSDLVAHGSVTRLLDGKAHGAEQKGDEGQELMEEGSSGVGAGVYALAMVASGGSQGAGAGEGVAELGLEAVAELFRSVCVKTRVEGDVSDEGVVELLAAGAAAMGLDPTAAAAAAATADGPLTAAGGCGGLTEAAARLTAVVLPAPGAGGGGAMGGGVAAVADPAAATGERFAEVRPQAWIPGNRPPCAFCSLVNDGASDVAGLKGIYPNMQPCHRTPGGSLLSPHPPGSGTPRRRWRSRGAARTDGGTRRRRRPAAATAGGADGCRRRHSHRYRHRRPHFRRHH